MQEKVAVVGLWHQGVVAAAVLADIGFTVQACDSDAEKIAQLEQGKSPIFEPGLEELLKSAMSSGKLVFSTDIEKATTQSTLVFLTHDTKVRDDDTSDLAEVEEAVERIAKSFDADKLLYVTAQVPVGSCDRFATQIAELTGMPREEVQIAYSPENLRLGKAIELFREPALPIIGANNPQTFKRLSSFMSTFCTDWTELDLRTAEMSKHALNSWLALNITFANELGQLCEALGADGHMLAKVLRREPRIGAKAPLLPGLGFSGGTLARDMRSLLHFCESHEIDAPLLNGLWNSNQAQNASLVQRLERFIGKSVDGLSIGVLGLTYKPETSTLRRSASLELIAMLQEAGASVRCHDPKADPQEVKELCKEEPLSSVEEVCEGADALVLMTPWEDYRNLNFSTLGEKMNTSCVLDTAGFWKQETVENCGFRYMTLGRAAAQKEN